MGAAPRRGLGHCAVRQCMRRCIVFSLKFNSLNFGVPPVSEDTIPLLVQVLVVQSGR